MDIIEEYRIRESMLDAISILDSTPIKPDLLPDRNLVQLTNRASIAHLAVERGLKSLIAQSGKDYKKIHCLDKLYAELRTCDSKSAEFLAKAFEDAVQFFGYDVKAPGIEHFHSIDGYLCKAGGNEAFMTMRYWAIEGTPEEVESPAVLVSLILHRELTCALACLFQRSRLETVSVRVERQVATALKKVRSDFELRDEARRDESIACYSNWLSSNQGSFCNALKEAARSSFVIEGCDEFARRNLQLAYEELKGSDDPAVRYFAIKLLYLPRDSQLHNPGYTPMTQWLDDKCRNALINTPAGHELGFVEKYADGSWGIRPLERGYYRVTDVAEDLEDAKNYLVSLLTRKANVVVNGLERQLLTVGDPNSPGSAKWTSSMEDAMAELSTPEEFEIEFWDCQHGLHTGQDIVIEILSNENPTIAWRYEGSVTKVDGQIIALESTEVLREIGEDSQSINNKPKGILEIG